MPTSQKVNSYDSQGRVYRTQTFSVDPTTGVVGAALAGNVFYDPDGNVLAVYATGKPTTKYLYDGADRLVAKYVTDGGAADNAGSPVLTWAAAGTVANDVVLSETDTTLDADGNAILTVGKDRLSSDAADATGVLGTTTAASRDSYLAAYYDAAGRLVAQADHGTTAVSAPSDSTPSGVPTRSDGVLVTSYGYDAAGNPASVTDPRGIASQSYFDLLGNTTKTIAAFTDGVPTASTNQTTAYTYDGDGHVLTMTAVLPTGQNSQTTKYVYGIGATAGTDLFSNDLIAKVEYPDLSTGAASPLAANDVSSTYDNLGEVLTKTDQNGSTHAYSYDVLGRLTLDAVTTLASGVDGSVLALGYNYNSQGLPYQQTSYSNAAATAIVNQVQDVYNGLGQLTDEYQANGGAVNIASTPQVQYGYSSIATGSHLVSMTYPNDRILHYGYDNSALDTAIGRVDYLADDNGSGSAGSHLVDYSYLGLATILGQAQGNGVAETTTLDGFGRIADLNYVNTATSTSTDHFAYGYDRNGNVLYKNNLVNGSFSELYHASSVTTGDSNTAYDPLNRLTGFVRGTLSSSGNNGTTLDTVTSGNQNSLAGSSQSWNLDAIGNQKSVTTNGTTVTRSANSQNELTGVGSSTLAYDHDGNTTTDETGKTLTYDAWNHLATAASGTHAVQTYAYDAQGRRISEYDAGIKTNLYLSSQGQVLEERQGTFVTAQNTWGIDYVNDLLARDTFTTPSLVKDFGANDQINAMIPEADGKVVAVGYAGWNTMVLSRFLADGQPDPTFGTDGYAALPGNDFEGFAVAQDANGDYLVTGNDTGNIAVWRFLPDGSIDTSFGSSGETVVNLGAYEYGTAVAVQADGKIVIAGASTDAEHGLPVIRLNGDGSLDSGFGASGIDAIDLGPADGVTIQSGGSIVISGSGADGYLTRLNASDGSTDTSFGTDGVVTIPGTVFKLTMQSTSDDRLVVMSQYQSAITISRYNADGSADTSFTTYAVELGWLGGNGGLAMQADGKIVFARSVYGSYPTQAAIVVGRLNADGSFDSSFNNGSTSPLQFSAGTNVDLVNALVVQADGQIVVGGCANAGGGSNDWGMARLNGGDTRQYAEHDANYNITTTTDAAGNVVKRFVYSAYGVQTVLTAAWAASGASSSVYGFQGGRYDRATGLNHFDARDYNPSLGKWMHQDPAGFIDGMNTYQYESSRPIGLLDPRGLVGEPVVSSINVKVVEGTPSVEAIGFSFSVKVTVDGKNLDCVEIRQLIKSSTQTQNWDGKPLTRDQIVAQTQGDPNVVDSSGKFVTDTGWDWSRLDNLNGDNTRGDKADEQYVSIMNRTVDIGNIRYTEVQRFSIARDFRIEVRQSNTGKMLKSIVWGYKWDNSLANWEKNAAVPPPQGDVVARGNNVGLFKDVYGVEGMPQNFISPATQPVTQPTTTPTTQPRR